MKTIIVDDERLARRELASQLKAFTEVEIAGEASNGEEAIELIDKLKPDLVFLDIQMPDMTGFEVLERLNDVPQVIFVTAFDEYALKAFEVNALDYVLKPVEEERLEESLEKVKSRRASAEAPTEASTSSEVLNLENQIFLKDGEKCWFVTLKDIRKFESEGNYVRVFFGDNKPLVLKSLNALEERLDPKVFFRANRKFIINLRWVEDIENWFNGGLRVQLRDGSHVEVSRRQSSKFKDLLSL
jgi:two-component system LytT family response regulator